MYHDREKPLIVLYNAEVPYGIVHFLAINSGDDPDKVQRRMIMKSKLENHGGVYSHTKAR